MSDTWTIGELAERAADALRAHAQPLNGRVRDVPGERLIRWYTTIGLVDPPLTRRGRIARYGRRHLLQLVAVKRLQAEGMSIADIQAALAGAPDASLEATARLPGPPPEAGDLRTPRGAGADARLGVSASGVVPPPGSPDGQEPPGTEAGAYLEDGRPRTRSRFWADRPAQGPDRGVRKPRGGFHEENPGAPAGGAGRTERRGGTPGAVHGVRLAGGVTLVLDEARRAPGDDDVRALLAAAGPLLAVLEERGLL
ncbi:MerR family transcriptional regulator [Nonomuraea sp. MCN248]|uniref:MerR family transcriptional regulator n=1 Tax=Nonomuraea corallina TaxID=2989783 RepID=A0ABT4SBV1_9ACTN|nr:MerR family transcriptional regulator [Nonomuraea corallina]MDA0634637.1 MerR family transcriptional regulator [Nonomuraea corallina]